MLVLSLGFGCNNACIFCAQGQLRSIGRDATADADLLVGASGETVAFVGGEPTLTESLPDLVQEADRRGAVRVIVQTNGRRLAYRTYARALAAASRKLVLDVSMHGSTEAMHDYHTATPGSFKQTAIGLRNAAAEGVLCGVTTVVTRSNYRHLAEIVDCARRLGSTAHHFAFAEPLGSARKIDARLVAAPELVRPYLALALAEARRHSMAIVVGERASSADAANRFAGTGIVERDVTVGADAHEGEDLDAAATANTLRSASERVSHPPSRAVLGALHQAAGGA